MEGMGGLNLGSIKVDRQQSKSGFWHGRRALVTGATGIIGSCLVHELLRLECHVVALVQDLDPQSELCRSGDINRVSVVNGSLDDFSTLQRAIGGKEVDVVFHLGAQTIVGHAQKFPLLTFESNVRGTYNLMEACRLQGESAPRVVIASSDKAYGEASTLPYTEDMPLNGRNPYDASKACADIIAQSFQHTYGLHAAIIRCGNVFGGGDLNWSRIVPGTIRSLMRKEQPIIRSDGSYLRDYIYVGDVAQAYIRAVECLDDASVKGAAFNISNESPVSVLELVQAIQKIMGCEHLEPVILNSAHGEIKDQYLSATKAKELLGWKPIYDLDQGLTETVQWYQDFLR